MAVRVELVERGGPAERLGVPPEPGRNEENLVEELERQGPRRSGELFPFAGHDTVERRELDGRPGPGIGGTHDATAHDVGAIVTVGAGIAIRRR